MQEIQFIAPAALHDEMLRLRNEKQMDFLESLTGMDWGAADEKDTPEKLRGLGVVYHLESTVTGERIAVKTATTNRELPEIPSVSDIWKIADFYEREVFDYYGITFIGHPDMRRLYLRNDWIGYPMRKDNDPEKDNPLCMTNEETFDTTQEIELNPDGTIKNKEMKLFGEEEYVVNIGPQHPATHGVMRFRVSLEGEIIRKIDANCGYIHRGIEKMNESLTYPQTLALTDRLDYLGAHQNRHALCMCIEKAMGVEVSERVQYIRTIMDELQRIDSHLLFFSALAMDLGALTAFFYGFRDREKILDIFEETCGGRLIMNYNTIGGVQADLHPNFVKRVKEFIPYMRGIIHEYHDIFTGNVIAQSRMKGVGVLSREDAISFGCTGGTGRASGWACDVRKRIPYGVYDKVDFKEIIEPLRDLFKDEVRKAGLELGIPEYLVFRQPFPGPGLGIRIIGEVTEEKVKIVQDADAIYREEIANAGLDRSIGQNFAALTNMRSVGVMGDERTYDYAIALRAVNTIDFMTAESAQIPYEVLNKVMSRIINEVRGVNRVMYDLTSKPPGTIEFE